jgi:hypothetical protein
MEDHIGDYRDCVQGPHHTDRDQPRLATTIGPSLQLHPHGASDHRHHHHAEEEGAD